jgi:hypothetical protein
MRCTRTYYSHHILRCITIDECHCVTYLRVAISALRIRSCSSARNLCNRVRSSSELALARSLSVTTARSCTTSAYAASPRRCSSRLRVSHHETTQHNDISPNVAKVQTTALLCTPGRKSPQDCGWMTQDLCLAESMHACSLICVHLRRDRNVHRGRRGNLTRSPLSPCADVPGTRCRKFGGLISRVQPNISSLRWTRQPNKSVRHPGASLSHHWSTHRSRF